MQEWISGFLVGVCLMFWFIILVGCATPQTHDEWVVKCFDTETPDEFDKCIKQWDDWALAQLERR